MLKRLLRDRKGISLTEVVIAMAVVLTVTGSAITLVISSIKADAGFRAKYQALTACENAADCLRFSKGNLEKLDYALNSVGFTVTDNIYSNGKNENTVKVIYQEDGDLNNNLFDYATVEYDGETVYTYNTN